MDLVPEFATNNRLVLAGIRFSLVDGFADVNPFVQELIEHTLVKVVAIAVGCAGSDQFASEQGGPAVISALSKCETQ